MKGCFVFLLLLLSHFGEAQVSGLDTVYCTDEDRVVFNQFLQQMEPQKSLPVGELMVMTARFFVGCPYVGGTLEKSPEGLVVNLREMDCTTLVETTLALVRTLKGDRPSFDDFCQQLERIRYRSGKCIGYTDRLHYMTDWIYENERKGLVKDKSEALGGKKLEVDVSFMSTHPDRYKPLKEYPVYLSAIASKEAEINARPYFYLPQGEINVHGQGIKEGDLVAFVTTLKGLDVSHVGIICRVGDKLTFIHASSSGKKVIVNEASLQEYVEGIKHNCGILVVRPQPRY